MVVFLKRPGGQAQFSATLALQAADDKFGALHDWINGHLGDDLSLSVLADQAGMSERSFSRHYAEATGQTPARAIERLEGGIGAASAFGVTHAGSNGSRSAAASAPRKRCAAASCAFSRSRRKTTVLASRSETHLTSTTV